ncbi:Dinucleotide-utilizing enzymes involved in molybdopterin and thiamine biosynthesis family 2 [Streptomyces formicae]|uniref:Dinucleotide-utilizing enzymes involved in molybdopterin and thiamine biosynthesis family 2 n=2 Tax=Streptomyces formicae TaxID=1616117 RepID=A0A291QL27_9ACTN|nr:Dinucleotide-utilizing enzymes involved in molybdopterin and thiamine biosynthesis family 2 [Streptomyces formicae]
MGSVLLDASTLEQLISAAIAAPSLYNTQPWRFRLAPDTSTVEIHTVAERGLPHVDPHGRALHLAAGAAAFNLRVAMVPTCWSPYASPVSRVVASTPLTTRSTPTLPLQAPSRCQNSATEPQEACWYDDGTTHVVEAQLGAR